MKADRIICGIALVTLMSCVSLVLGQEQGGFAGNKVTPQVIANIMTFRLARWSQDTSIMEMNFIWFLLANGPLKLKEGPSRT